MGDVLFMIKVDFDAAKIEILPEWNFPIPASLGY
jgi:hypothetical protein